MKNSDLKQYIKEKIITTLSEDMNNPRMILSDFYVKVGGRNFAAAITDIEDDNLLDDIVKALNFREKDGVSYYGKMEEDTIPGFGVGKDDEEIEKLKKDFDSAKSGADLPPEATVQDIAAYYASNPPKMVSEDDDEDDKDAIRGAKKAGGKFKKLDLAVQELEDLKTEMRSMARKYSEADGIEKEKIKNELKDKTSEKRELESYISKLEKDAI